MRGVWLILVAACYRPEAALGVPCSAGGECPSGQICDTRTMPPTCVVTLVDAGATWSTPTKIVLTGIPAGDLDDPTLTDDLLEMYFNLADDIYVTKRDSLASAWGPPALVAVLNSAMAETTPELSGDGLRMYFSSDRAGTLGVLDIMMSSRASRDLPWDVPTFVPALDSTGDDFGGLATPDQKTIIFSSNRGGVPGRLFVSTRPASTAMWGAPSELTGLTSGKGEGGGLLSRDELTLYYDSERTGDSHLYVTHRASATDAWFAGAPISELNSTTHDTDLWVSPDERYAVFASRRGGPMELWESHR